MKIRKWKLTSLKKDIMEKKLSTKALCKKYKIRPSSLYTYKSRFDLDVKESRGKTSSIPSPPEIGQQQRELPKKEGRPQIKEGVAPEWITRQKKAPLGPRDPLGLKEAQRQGSIPGFIYDQMTPEERIRIEIPHRLSGLYRDWLEKRGKEITDENKKRKVSWGPDGFSEIK